MNSHSCLDCSHSFNEEGQNGPHIQTAVQCPNCHSYRTQPSGIPDEANDMLHGLQGMPTSTEDDMAGNPLKEGILADGGFKNRQVRDESFASVRSKISLFETPEFETTQIVAPPDLYRHGLETEAAHRTGVQLPKGITDNLHAALGNLGAWVDNPYENNQLRPYNQYWKVIRPSFMKPGSLRIGVADPTMAEIINHVAQTDDLTPLYEYRGKTSHTKTAGPLMAMLPEGVAALLGGGAAAGGEAAAGAGAAEAAAGAAGAGAAEAGAGAAGGAAGGGLINGLTNPVKWGEGAAMQAGKGVYDDMFGAPGAGAGAGGMTMPVEPTSFYSRRLALFSELLEGLGGGAKAAEGAAEGASKVPAPAIGGLMKKLVVPLGMSDDVLGLGGGQGAGGTNNMGAPQGTSFFSRNASEEDDMFPSSHDEVPKNEDGDHKQQDDGNNHEWQRDVSVNGGGGTEHSPSFDSAGPAFQRLMMLAPLLLQFLDSGQDASNDPLVKGLHDSFESELPGYLDHADDNAGQHLIMVLRGAPGEAEPEKNEETHTDENSGGKHDSKVASVQVDDVTGGDFLPDMDTIPPSLNGMNKQADINQLYQIAELRKGLPQDIQAEISRMMLEDGATTVLSYLQNMTRSNTPQPPPAANPYWDSMNDPVVGKTAVTQGPNTPEQIQAVQQWLMEHGPELKLQGDELIQTVLSVPTNPLEFADVLAQIQRSEPPPTPPQQDGGLSAGPPAPAQENAPPEATMPMPGMSQQMMSAIERYSADSVAGVCPNCGGHTTELIDEDGTSQCHGCGNTFKTEGKTPNKMNSTSSWRVEADLDSMDDSSVQGVPIADQQGQHDLREEQDSGHTWMDEHGNPLKVGSQYEMYSGKYDIPDLVRIDAVRPTSLSYTITGEFGVEHSTELPKEEADIEKVAFEPKHGEEHGVDEGLEFNNDDNTAFQGAPERSDSSAPVGLVSSTATTSSSGANYTFNFAPTAPAENPKLAWLMQGVSRTAGANYTAMEQRDLIDEQGTARNSGMLDLSGTHYDDADEDQFLFGY